MKTHPNNAEPNLCRSGSRDLRSPTARHQHFRLQEMAGSCGSGTSPIDSVKQSSDIRIGLFARCQKLKHPEGGTATEAVLRAACNSAYIMKRKLIAMSQRYVTALRKHRLGLKVRFLSLKREARSSKELKNAIASARRLVVKSVKSVRRFARQLDALHPSTGRPS